MRGEFAFVLATPPLHQPRQTPFRGVVAGDGVVVAQQPGARVGDGGRETPVLQQEAVAPEPRARQGGASGYAT